MSAAVLQYIVSTDGTRLAVWRSGAGPPLVAVHGTTADHTRWTRVAPLLESRFSLHAMDRRGRGRSGDSASYSLRQEGDDVAAVVRDAGEDVSLFGHSYGALCCIEAALHLPDLYRLILYEPPLPLGEPLLQPGTQDEIERLLADGDREGALILFFREVVRVPDRELELLRAHPAWRGRIASAHTIARESNVEAAYSLDLRRLQELKVPTLLILGGDSPTFFRQATEVLNETIPNSRIVELPGQQHIAMDTVPEQFVDAITSFVFSSSGIGPGVRS